MNSLNILVVDDTNDQLEMAKLLLVGHKVTTISGWAATKKALMGKNYDNPNHFDIVLTDMMMPGESEGLGNYSRVGELVPYGFNVAMLALRCGVAKVAVVSNGQGDDGNHHQDPILWACDELHGFNFEGRLMFFTGYDCPFKFPSLLKDWKKVLDRLLE